MKIGKPQEVRISAYISFGYWFNLGSFDWMNGMKKEGN